MLIQITRCTRCCTSIHSHSDMINRTDGRASTTFQITTLPLDLKLTLSFGSACRHQRSKSRLIEKRMAANDQRRTSAGSRCSHREAERAVPPGLARKQSKPSQCQKYPPL